MALDGALEGAEEPKRLMMSSTALLGCCVGAAAAPLLEEPPKISARRLSLLGALDWPLGAAGVSSEPSRSTYESYQSMTRTMINVSKTGVRTSWFCVDPTGLFSLTVSIVSMRDARRTQNAHTNAHNRLLDLRWWHTLQHTNSQVA